MPAPFVIPFNNCPISISVKTASYTIPAGKYARIITEVDSGGLFTIDAVTAMSSAAFVNIDSGNATNAVLNYTVPTGFRAEVTCATTVAGDTYTVNGNSATSMGANAQSTPLQVGPAGTVSLGAGVVNNKGIHGTAYPSNATNRQATFWVPTGTVISGSGNWKAVVQEYNVIS